MISLITFFALISNNIPDLTKDHFFEYTSKEERITCIMLYCKFCPGCSDVKPILEELSRMYYQEPRVQFGMINCDKYEDLCNTFSTEKRPAWLVWFPGDSHHKLYNRDYTPDNFVRFIRQKTGIRPSQLENNLLYMNSSEYDQFSRKNQCLFTIIDEPGMTVSQELHHAARSLEKKVLRGVKFAALDKYENNEKYEKLNGKSFGAILHYRGRWINYDGENDSNEILQFLRDQGCSISIATPSPTPAPLPELEDKDIGDDVIFDDDNQPTNPQGENDENHSEKNAKQMEEEDFEEDSDNDNDDEEWNFDSD